MALNILLAAPNKDYLIENSEFLKQNHFNVEHASNGKDAQILFTKSPYFAIVVHVELQNYSSQQFLKFVKSRQSAEKIIVIGCSEEKLKELEIDPDSLYKLGVTEIYSDEPSKTSLKNVLEGHQNIHDVISSLPKREGASNEEMLESADGQYTGVEIHSFVPGKNVIFDVFIKLGSNKYLKILHAGDQFLADRFNKYRDEKKVSHFYINTNDRSKLVQWNNFVIEKFAASNKVEAEKKVGLLKTTSEKMLEGLYLDGLKPQMVDQARTLCQNTYKTIEKEKNIYKLLRQFQDMDPNAYSHSFNVSLFAGMICKQFEWNSQTIFETFTMASLLHDIGKTKLPPELMSKKLHEMTKEEEALWRTHPQLSVDILETSSMITQPVKQIILQHHEASDGSGFPFGVRDSNILTSSKILIFVNDFVDLITEKKINPIEGVRIVLGNKDLTKKYNGLVLENFTKIFMDPDKVQKNVALPSNSKIVPFTRTE
jgi:HD-GYP domain-containing protein (c-di-GMP phosphodiesterase class II)